MSARPARRRGRPPKTAVLERPKKFQYHLLKKPKYLLNRESSKDGDNNSQASTPSHSRGCSPDTNDSYTSRSGRSARKRSKYGQRSASKRGGKTGHTSRLYAYSLAAERASDYHYGSDFDEDSDKSDVDNLKSESELEDGLDQISDSEVSELSYPSSDLPKNKISYIRPPSPDPLWLQDLNLPQLVLPKTSEDLLIPTEHAMQTVGIYEVLRHFRNLVRLSPFRLECFCAALTLDEQNTLLVEIHIMLLKAIFREEDSQQTHFGPLDQKDSVNACIYFIDPMTWPEVLRSYVESDKSFDTEVSAIMSSGEYPFVPVDKRLKVLQFLTDQFLATNPVREDLIYEGPFHYDDHCRICHRLGDLLCCETCPAVYHLECVDPPLPEVPEEDWQCAVCRSHWTSGVNDCISESEKSGALSRQEPLGVDRVGRKYWFLCRRIFVDDAGETWYYSTPAQFEELLYSLDPKYMEKELCRNLQAIKDVIINHMGITETLTNSTKGTRKSYLEVENAELVKIQEERRTKQGSNEVDEVEARLIQELEAAEELTRMLTGSDDPPPNDIETEEVSLNLDEQMTVDDAHCEVVTTATTDPETEAEPETKDKQVNGKTKTTDATDNVHLTRLRTQQIATGTFLYKLGQDKECKSYVNQYTLNVYALNKPQRNEERDKKRHLSHKFSLTQASEFKWVGSVFGLKSILVLTLRVTMVQLETSIPSSLMHVNWPLIRKTWLITVQSCNTPWDFARVLVAFQACVRPVVFASVWHEQLGHVRLQRVTAAEREERKKIEKREKKEKEDEEERNRLSVNFIKYTLGLKHSVQKQKGEEYRIHGQWGWQWLSATRKLIIQDALKMGLRARPEKIMIEVIEDSVRRLYTVDPKTYSFILKKRELENNPDAEPVIAQTAAEVEFDKRYKFVTPPITSFESINISEALSTTARLHYPKIATKSKLDDFLERRLKLKMAEEKHLIEMGIKPKPEEPVDLKQFAPHIVDKLKVYVATCIKFRKYLATCKNPCYSKYCATGCYSPSCLAKQLFKVRTSALVNSLQTVMSTKTLQSVLENMEKTMAPLQKLKTEKVDVKNVETKPNIPNETLKTEPSLKVPDSFTEEQVVSTAGEEIVITECKTEEDVDVEVDVCSKDPVKNSPTKTSILSSILSVKDEKPEEPKKLGPDEVLLPDGTIFKREFTQQFTTGKVYLKKIIIEGTEKKKRKGGIKFPRVSKFRSKLKKNSLMVLSRSDLRKLARHGGKYALNGFHHGAKSNPQAWPYPNSRPLFKTCWQYRTITSQSISSIALQLRILWACLRWDDMQVKPQSMDGKTQITTETEIISLEILKHRHVGEYLDKTQYLRRKVVIPLELPKTVHTANPIRSGLRKRKREETPQSTDPQVSKEWVDEDKLELWEIKLYADRVERSNNVTMTRTRTGSLPIKQDKTETNIIKAENIITKGTPEEIKEKMEIQLRAQRAAHYQKKSETSLVKTPSGHIIKLLPAQTVSADGCVKVIGKATPQNNVKTLTSLLSTPTTTTANKTVIGTRKLFMSKEGLTAKVVNPILQKVPGQQSLIKIQPQPTIHQQIQPQANTTQHLTAVTTPGSNRLQIVQLGTDGKVQLRGMQQVVQMPDGKSYVLRTQPGNAVTPTSVVVTQPVANIVNAVTTTLPTATAQPTQYIVKNAQGQSLRVISSIAPQLKSQLQQKSLFLNKDGKVMLTTSAAAAAAAAGGSATTPLTSAPQIIASSAQPTFVQNTVVMRGSQVLGTTNDKGQVVWSPGIKPNMANIGSIANLQQQKPGTVTVMAKTGNALGKQLTEGKFVIVNGQPVMLRAANSPGPNQIRLGTNQLQQLLANSPTVQAAVTPLTPQKSSVTETTTAPAQAQTFPKTQQSVVQTPASSEVTPNPRPVAQIRPQILKKIITPTGTILQSRLQAKKPESDAQNEPEVQKSNDVGEVDTPEKQKVLEGQPPGTVIQTITAQITNTPDGQRLLVQGLEGSNFSPQQLQMIHNQIRTQFFKVAGNSSKDEPTKIYLAVQPKVNVQPEPVSEEKLVKLETVGTPLSTPIGNRTRPTVVRNLMDIKSPPNAVTELIRGDGPNPVDNPLQPSEVEALLAQNESPQQNQQNDFIITPDYIQQTIKHALKQENLNPEIEEKLLQLQRYQERQMRGEIPPPQQQQQQRLATPSPPPLPPPTLPPPRASQSRKRPAPSHATPDPEHSRAKRVQKTEPKVEKSPMKPEPVEGKATPKSKYKGKETQEEKKRQALCKHTDNLKKEILKRRTFVERELLIEIQREVTAELAAESVRAAGGRRKTPMPPPSRHPGRPKKSPSSTSPISPSMRKKRTCICRTFYDSTKFYVSCDACQNWFHGACVGISEAMYKKISEFVCDECKQSRNKQQRYCLCKQPYDDSQFYICCDKCQDWFHGRCVGILPSEADSIDEYNCPNCDEDSNINYANMKVMNAQDYDALKKLIKQLQSHKSAWPFMEPVDAAEAPDYYKVIKDPIDLQKIESKTNERKYKNLSEFIGDMTKLFDNCRYYNPKESQFCRCAEGLESFFAQKVKFIREKILENQ